MKRLALALALIAGCTSQQPNPQVPPPIAVVAVLPFVGNGFDGDEFGNILASEVAKIAGVRVIRPSQIRSEMQRGETLTTTADAVRAGRRARADAVLACAITDYDPYDPPKVAVAVQFLRVSILPLGAPDLDRIMQSASWRGPLTHNRPGHGIAAFEEVYDAHEGRVRSELQAYAQKQISGDSAFVAEREFLAVQSRYLQFVSSRVIRRAWEGLSSHGS